MKLQKYKKKSCNQLQTQLIIEYYLLEILNQYRLLTLFGCSRWSEDSHLCSEHTPLISEQGHAAARTWTFHLYRG